MPSLAIKRGRRGGPAVFTLLRYAVQSVETLLALAWRRPRVVFVTSPPVFAAFPVYLYALVFRARYVVDCHSGCFLDAHWRRWDRWQRFFARRAVLNIAHNAENAAVLEAWKAPFTVLPSIPPDLVGAGTTAALPTEQRPLAVYVCSFKDDEPVEALLDAARGLPELDFAVSGRAPPRIAQLLPPNARLTGFLPDEDYNRLLGSADLVIALTTRPGTLLYGAQEAIALGKPLVLSRTPTLEAYFPEGTVFAANEPAALARGIRDALARKEDLGAAMARFRDRYLEEGAARLSDIRKRVGL
jgi:glycosyltransferase involved in cell wall biosynthesis